MIAFLNSRWWIWGKN